MRGVEFLVLLGFLGHNGGSAIGFEGGRVVAWPCCLHAVDISRRGIFALYAGEAEQSMIWCEVRNKQPR